RDADWVSAMQEELDQFARLKVWRLVPRPEGKTIIKTKWIFKNKKDESSLVIQNKARLTTFLNGILKEEVYVGQPPSFVSKQYPDHMYALDKALYGLKQEPRAWYDVLSKFLIDSGFQKVENPVDHTNYRSMIGSLMYVTSSGPDIMFATCMCARYQANPNEHHVSAVKRIFRYLKWTINLGLWYPKDSGFDLTAYLDTDHAGYHLDRKSTSSSVQFLGDKLVCWSSKKQNCVSISTAESEYVVVSSCCAQVLWMRTQLIDYGFFYEKVPIYCDSKSAIAISCNSVPVKVAYDKHALWEISHWREQCKTFYGYARGLQSTHDVYSIKRILAVTQVEVMRKHGYGYLKEIVVRRADNDLYRFKEGEFPHLRINNIEDILLLVVQNRLTNLSGDDVFDFAISLRMFTRILVI
nr:uncharacterized mitochondrial protein AtMg00810-like [Tanacetum cinerariifolium]